MSNALEPFDFTKIRLFVEDDLEGAVQLTLPRGPAHYLRSVMRQGVGDGILVFNGRDGEWLARLVEVAKKVVRLEVERQMRTQDGVPDLHLLFAPVKRARLDYLVQKATELGVRSIRPVFTARTNVARINQERMRANVIEAAEQSGRMSVPEVESAIKLAALLADWPVDRSLLFCDEAGDAPPMGEALASASSGSWAVLIGPEGGFDGAEREKIRKHPQAVPVSLGPRIMRADTAAVAALAIWQSIMGDLS